LIADSGFRFMESLLEEIGQKAKAASRQLATLSTEKKNEVLLSIAEHLRIENKSILSANETDVNKAKANGLSHALIDRLFLTSERLNAIADDVVAVTKLFDPVGEVFDERVLVNGMNARKRRVPLGVVGVIYEARPNVTVDVATLCLKTGNAVILRGGKETVNTNSALTAVIQNALYSLDITQDVVQIIADTSRDRILELLKMDKYVDMIIPRGGAGLHDFCRQNATVPVITGGIGVCHLFVDRSANIEKSIPVIHNAKVQRPGVCNALDTLLVHEEIAPKILPLIAKDLTEANVEIRAEEKAFALMDGAKRAGEGDFGKEFLALILSVKIVKDVDEAIEHIWQYGSGHSESILTEDERTAKQFVERIDSSAIFVNASTRFNDGGQLGLGAEVAVSTQKLHARGPMGLQELTTYKWIVGNVSEGYFVRG